MLQSRYIFAILFKGYRDALAVFMQSSSVPVFDAQRTKHYVAQASDQMCMSCLRTPREKCTSATPASTKPETELRLGTSLLAWKFLSFSHQGCHYKINLTLKPLDTRAYQLRLYMLNFAFFPLLKMAFACRK